MFEIQDEGAFERCWVTIYKDGKEFCHVPYDDDVTDKREQAIARAEQIVAALESFDDYMEGA